MKWFQGNNNKPRFCVWVHISIGNCQNPRQDDFVYGHTPLVMHFFTQQICYISVEGQFNLHHLILINDPKPICHSDSVYFANMAWLFFCRLNFTKDGGTFAKIIITLLGLPKIESDFKHYYFHLACFERGNTI